MDERVITLEEKDARYCSHGDTVHYAHPPKVFARCAGSFLYDESDTPYLDWQMWYSAASFGYANKRLSEVLKRQIDTLPQLACQYLHREKVELAEIICRHVEDRYGVKGRVHFNVGGSQAIEDSLKLIRNATGKNLVYAFTGGYHGRTLGASAITSSYRYRRRFGHFSDRAQFVPFPYCFRCPYDLKRDSCDLYCHKQFERQFDTEYNGVWDDKAKQSEFAAFYIETVQGTGGYVIPPKEYFPALARTLKERGILLVVDEIQMGVLRTGKLWSWENFGIVPDVFVFGKALTNGLNPISGIWAREELISPEKFPPGSTHSTFSSNPLGTAVGLEVMRMAAQDGLGEAIVQKGAYLMKRLRELRARWKMIGDVDGIGLAVRIEMCGADGHTPNRELADRMFNAGLKGDLPAGGRNYGMVLDVGGYYKNVFTLAPSFESTTEELDLGVTLFETLLDRCGAS